MVGRNGSVIAEQANTNSLVISQLKITSGNGQFITLYNSSDTAIDMSKYQLQYYNNYDLAKATSSKLIPLSGTVPPHGYFMVNDSAFMLCYQLTIDSVSLGLSSTAGMIGIMGFSQAAPGLAVIPVLHDYVAWSKTPASGAQTLPPGSNAFLQRQPSDSSNNPSVKSPGAGTWQTVLPDENNACKLTTSTGAALPTPAGLGQLLPPSEPPASIVSLAPEAKSGGSATLPASDIGLMSPVVSELLPNPMGTGNDTTDEFIELYNPNDKSFDLEGFILQTGLTTTRKYTFPTGSSLSAHSFKAFYSEMTGLSLSNTSSQAKLLDPPGNIVSSSEPYTSAKDGQAWGLAKGKWYWTGKLTPDKANVIKQPVTSKKTTATKTKASSGGAKPGQTSSFNQDEPVLVPIHTKTIALVIAAALIYGAYEYRADARNKLYQLRSYFRNRTSNRK